VQQYFQGLFVDIVFEGHETRMITEEDRNSNLSFCSF